MEFSTYNNDFLQNVIKWQLPVLSLDMKWQHFMNFYWQADEAYHIGPPAANQSYLQQNIIINVAKKSGAQVGWNCFFLFFFIFAYSTVSLSKIYHGSPGINPFATY